MTAPIGHNLPPVERHREIVDGLYEEASHWLDGEGIRSADDADGVSKLLDMLRTARKEADAQRAAEKRPHDDAAKAVQETWKPLLDRADRAATVCKEALAAWLARVDAEKRAKAEQARREAEAAEIAAQRAFASAGVGDLAEREAAEKLLADAKAANAAAGRAERDKAQAKGGARAVSLRTVYRPEITDYQDVARYVWQRHRDDMAVWLDDYVAKLVRAGNHRIPGVVVHEEKVAV